MIGRRLMFFAKPLQRSNLCASHRQRRWLTHGELNGGEAGIRTLGRGFSPYNGLANRRLQPLGHLTGDL